MKAPDKVPAFTYCGPLSGLLDRAATVARRQQSAERRAASLAERREQEHQMPSQRYNPAA